jgi:hypothetical protein
MNLRNRFKTKKIYRKKKGGSSRRSYGHIRSRIDDKRMHDKKTHDKHKDKVKTYIQQTDDRKLSALLKAVNKEYNKSQDNTLSFKSSYSRLNPEKKNEKEKIIIESASLIQFINNAKEVYNYDIPPDALTCLNCMGSVKGQFLRDAVETISPTQQCMKTIGEPHNGMPCYLCGLPMNTNDPKDLKPECEHVLPILQALILSDIYSIDSRPIIQPTSQIFQVEYKWAHKHCNAMKSNISLINFDSGNRQISPNQEHIDKLLTKIFFKNINKIFSAVLQRANINKILNDIINISGPAPNKILTPTNKDNLLHPSLIKKLQDKNKDLIKQHIQHQKTIVERVIQEFCNLYNQRVLSNPGLDILATGGSIATIFKNIVNKLEYNMKKAKERQAIQEDDDS